jgi:hypothetical protein
LPQAPFSGTPVLDGLSIKPNPGHLVDTVMYSFQCIMIIVVRRVKNFGQSCPGMDLYAFIPPGDGPAEKWWPRLSPSLTLHAQQSCCGLLNYMGKFMGE